MTQTARRLVSPLVFLFLLYPPLGQAQTVRVAPVEGVRPVLVAPAGVNAPAPLAAPSLSAPSLTLPSALPSLLPAAVPGAQAAGRAAAAAAAPAGWAGASAVNGVLPVHDLLSNPSESYGRALKEARAAAAARGADPASVRFVEATAGMPVQDGAHWKYAFEAARKDGKTSLVYVDFNRFLGGDLESRVSVFDGARADPARLAAALQPVSVAMGTRRLGPEGALSEARRAHPALGGGVSVALHYQEEPVSGDRDLWYKFHDDHGAVVSVNARTAEARVDAPKVPASLKASVSKASPIEGFSSFVYDAALAAVKPLSAQAGYRPDNLRLTGARLSPRAWGEDWTFSFVSPRQGYEKGPRAFEVSVRRTMVSETLVDALGAKDLGPVRLFTGFMASEVGAAVKVAPMDVVAASGEEARTLELAARWSAGGGPAELVYVLRDAKGRELQSVNAATGAVAVPQPYAWLKGALVLLGLFALTALIYGALFYAIGHAPAATSAVQVPPGWQGPVPTDIDIGSLFGR